VETIYKNAYRIRAWKDERNVLNFDAATEGGNTIACGYDMSGMMSRAEAVKRMQRAVDSVIAHSGTHRASAKKFRRTTAS
jgi:hypothetical protein